MELVVSNVVVTASQFNPSIVNQSWLMKHGIILEDEVEPPTIFVDGVSQIETSQFQLVVVPHMLQFVIKPLAKNEKQLIATRVGGIVKSLPHTPYVGVGLNFVWHAHPERETIHDLTRRLFFKAGTTPFSFFDEAGAHFGAYMSKNFGIFRLKLDIKPVVFAKPGSPPIGDRLMFAFNFDKQLVPENSVAEILDCLSLWDTAKSESEKIASRTCTREAQ